jgi:NAD(P)-dependent dehydrogenase (short-subunit alcohol dehydrogenase family)
MRSLRKTAIVTGASQGIGAGIVKAFVERAFDVVANSRKVAQSSEVAAFDHVALVDGHIGVPATAAKGAPGIKFVVSYGDSVVCGRGGAATAEGGMSVLRTRWTSACAWRTMCPPRFAP